MKQNLYHANMDIRAMKKTLQCFLESKQTRRPSSKSTGIRRKSKYPAVFLPLFPAYTNIIYKVIFSVTDDDN